MNSRWFAIMSLLVLGCSGGPEVIEGASGLDDEFGDGKFDASAIAVFLEFEYDAELLTSSCYNVESAIDEQALYDPRELAENLIDYVDPDDVRMDGGLEDAYYQQQPSPYRAANRPLLSVDELGLVEGFDAALVDVIRPYITVYPFVGGGGVNPNTAPPHILALICYSDDQGEAGLKLADEEDVQRILEIRESGQIFCPDKGSPACTPISGILPNSETILPPLSYFSDTFTVRSEARVGEVRRTLETVIDRTTPSEPLLLSWKVR